MTNKNKSGHELRIRISKEFRKRIKQSPLPYHHPVIDASGTWKTLSEQLRIIFGESIYRQWFLPIRPIVLINGVLILKTKNRRHVHWINQHYQETIDLILSTHKKGLQSFFISDNDTVIKSEKRPLPVMTSTVIQTRLSDSRL